MAFCLVAYYTTYKAYPQKEQEKGLVLLSGADWNPKLHGGHIKSVVDGTLGIAKNPGSMKAWGSAVSSVGVTMMTLLMVSNPALGMAGGALILLGGMLGAFGEDPAAVARKKFNDDLKQNLTEIKQNQEVMLSMLNDLKNGQQVILDTINEKSATSELRDVLYTYGWTGNRGLESIASRYKKVLSRLEYQIGAIQQEGDGLTEDEILQRALYRAGKFAHRQLNDELLSA